MSIDRLVSVDVIDVDAVGRDNRNNLERLEGEIVVVGALLLLLLLYSMDIGSDSNSKTCSSIYSLLSIMSSSPHAVTLAPIFVLVVLASKY